MSAYMVNADTINLLSSAALDPAWRMPGTHDSGLSVYAPTGQLKCHTKEARDLVRADGWSTKYEILDATYSDLGTIARELVAANYFSLIARYRQEYNLEEMQEVIEAHEFRPVNPTEATRLDVLGAIHCYRYQACEAGDEESRLWGRFCSALERRVVGELPGVKWEYTRPTSAPVSILAMVEGGK